MEEKVTLDAIKGSKQRCRPAQFRRMAVFLLVLLISLASKPLLSQQAPLQKLTLSQIEELVTHSVPDSTLSVQIERRGIAFTPTSNILDALRVMKAGPLTLAAISRSSAAAKLAASANVVAPGVARHLSKLSRTQLQHLLRIHVSDRFLSEQIQSRGISFPLTQADVNTIANEGAGPNTVAALRPLVVTGSVLIDTQPGASVSFDGKAVGVTGNGGMLQLNDILPGQHTISLQKPSYHNASQSFTLGQRENHRVSISMDWLGGYLSIRVKPTNASVTITGQRSFSSAAGFIPCPPGDYTINASAVGYLSSSKQVHIDQGSKVVAELDLQVNPSYVSLTLNSAEAALTSGNLHRAVHDAGTVLLLSPRNGAAEGILAEAAYQDGDAQSFADEAAGAMHNGAAVTFQLLHLRTWPSFQLKPVQLTFSARGIAFSGETDGRKQRLPFLLTYSQVTAAQVQHLPTGTLELLVEWTEGGHHKKAEFVANGSQAVQPQSGTIVLFSTRGSSVRGVPYARSPANAQQMLSGIARLFYQVP